MFTPLTPHRQTKLTRTRRVLVFIFMGVLVFGDFQNIYYGIPRAEAAENIFTTGGTNTWVAPTNTYQVTVQVWGGGGGSGGGTDTLLPGGSGGGGGAYASKVISVTPGVSYSYTVGAAGAVDGGAAGGNSSFTGDSGVQAIACGGTSGAVNGGTAGAGGTTACSDGATEYAGGAGAAGAVTSGGGGGESASTTANGNGAVGTMGGTGTAGTDGSAGQLVGGAGVAGNSPGAGAGGSGRRSGGSEAGAVGGVGRVHLTHFPAVLTISGTVYTNEGVTALSSAGKVLRLRVGTSTPGLFSTTTLSSTGFFQFQNLTGMSPGTTFRAWVDNDTTFRSFAMSKASSAVNNITNFDLYQNRIRVKHEGILSTTGTTSSNAELGLYDGDDDLDIQFTSNSSNLVTNAGQKLLVAYGTHYAPGGTITLHSSSTMPSPSGDFQLEQRISTSSIITLGGTLSISGSYFASSSSIFNPNGFGLLFTATSTGKVIHGELIGDSAFGSTTFSGVGGGWTYTDSASTTGDLRITAGTVTAPSTNFTIGGSYTNNGTFTNNGGTLYFSSKILAGVLNGSSAFNNIIVETPETWTTSYDTTELYILSLTVDSTNGVLYAGTNASGIIYRCATSTLCDAAGDWTISYDTPEDTIYSFTLDTTNGVLYAGTGINGIIYRCATSTLCDAAIDWTTSYDTTERDIRSLTFNSANGVIYAGTSDNSIIYRCATSTLCDAAIDWTTSNDTLDVTIGSLTVDSTNGVIYAGSYPGAIIYRCATSSLCDAAGDWTTSYDAPEPESSVRSLTFDSTNGVLYAGTNPGGVIYRCVTSTLCDAGGDWATSTDTTQTTIYSLTFDSTNGVLYAGTDSNGIIYRCLTATLCDAAGDWTTVYDTTEVAISSLTTDSTNGVLYAGSGSGGLVYRRGPLSNFVLQSNASTTGNFTIGSDVTVVAPPLLSIGGNYTNSGTFTHSSGIVYLNGTTPQTATGTMIGTSAFNNLTILNNSGTNPESNPGIIFGATGSTTGTFTAVVASTTMRFPANATTSMTNIVLTGTSALAPIFLRSSAIGTYAGLSVSGTQSITYADVRDSNACSGNANMSSITSTNSGNNICWTFTAAPVLNLLHYRWRMDHETEVSAGYYEAEDTAMTNRTYRGDRLRLRMTLQNTGTVSATNYNYRLEYASSSCNAWNNLGTTNEWFADFTQHQNPYSFTTDSSGLSNPVGSTFQSGVFRAGSATTGPYTLPNAYFTEHEFTITTTALAQRGINYCFRLTNDGSTTNFVYTTTPQVNLRGNAHPSTGGSSLENVGTAPAVAGGGVGGGSAGEGVGTAPPVGGGGGGGGRNLE